MTWNYGAPLLLILFIKGRSSLSYAAIEMFCKSSAVPSMANTVDPSSTDSSSEEQEATTLLTPVYLLSQSHPPSFDPKDPISFWQSRVAQHINEGLIENLDTYSLIITQFAQYHEIGFDTLMRTNSMVQSKHNFGQTLITESYDLGFIENEIKIVQDMVTTLDNSNRQQTATIISDNTTLLTDLSDVISRLKTSKLLITLSLDQNWNAAIANTYLADLSAAANLLQEYSILVEKTNENAQDKTLRKLKSRQTEIGTEITHLIYKNSYLNSFIVNIQEKIILHDSKLNYLDLRLSKLETTSLEIPISVPTLDTPIYNESSFLKHLSFKNISNSNYFLDVSFMGGQNILHKALTTPPADIVSLLNLMRSSLIYLLSCHSCELSIGSLALTVSACSGLICLFMVTCCSSYKSYQAEGAYKVASGQMEDVDELTARIVAIERQNHDMIRDIANMRENCKEIDLRVKKVQKDTPEFSSFSRQLAHGNRLSKTLAL